MTVVRVGDQGQITLPDDVQAAAGIADGSELLVIPLGADGVLLQPLPPREPVLALAEQYAQPGAAPTDEAIEAAVREAIREEWGWRHKG